MWALLFDSFTWPTGYSGNLVVHNKESVLETHFTKASTECFAAVVTITDEKADVFIVTVSTLVSQATAALSSIVVKKPEFDTILLATALVKSDIKNLDTQSKALDTCPG
ncbi:hypothetical protein MAM1_0088d04808 [Mucor ambiguus]|uniref:Uncharacterized protein n=1 Tax=Mucor ambiguus TaxID=91626 RepID=A0A0C9MTF5_9FUNG|nr:hypothetical protein MAM1_0088d04808 [Mucor ambiguus]